MTSFAQRYGVSDWRVLDAAAKSIREDVWRRTGVPATAHGTVFLAIAGAALRAARLRQEEIDREAKPPTPEPSWSERLDAIAARAVLSFDLPEEAWAEVRLGIRESVERAAAKGNGP